MNFNKLRRVLIGLVISVFAFSSCVEIDQPVVRTAATGDAELQDYLNTLVSDGHDIDTTSSGVYYIVIDSGVEPTPQVYDTLSVDYKVFLFNGNLLDASELHGPEGSTFDFVFRDDFSETEDGLIVGFEDGVEAMGVGAKHQLMIPWELAYGAYGTDGIPPYSPIIFMVTMVDIKPEFIVDSPEN